MKTDMKIKQLEWDDYFDHAGNWRTSFSKDDTPQMYYRINKVWVTGHSDLTFRLEFSHGYIPADLGRNYGENLGDMFDDPDEAKVAAQRHFENYVTMHFLTQ
jgi:hypothetical protein